MDKDLERTIADGLRAGDRCAWLKLYDAYAERLWTGVGRRMGFDCQALADVVQESLLAAARSAKGFDPGRGSLWGWLWGIARRQIALHYRKAGAAGALANAGSWSAPVENLDNWIDGKSDLPQDILESRELASLVRSALRALPEDYQMLLVAKHVDGRSVEAMARDVNCSQAAVASKLARAKKAFRKSFRKLGRAAGSMTDTTEVSP